MQTLNHAIKTGPTRIIIALKFHVHMLQATNDTLLHCYSNVGSGQGPSCLRA